MAKGTYDIPAGTKNLSKLFPSIDWRDISDYFIEVLDASSSVIATSNKVQVCNCVNDEGIRIHFINYCGRVDAINFLKPKIVHEPTSAEFQMSLPHPFEKSDASIVRFDIRSNDTYEAKRKCLEQEMEWIQELIDSPKAWIEWLGIEGQADDYLPIVLLNTKIEKSKTDREYDYELVLQFKLGNEFMTLRN